MNILITGAAGKIGSALAQRLAAAGDRLALHYYKNQPDGIPLLCKGRLGGVDRAKSTSPCPSLQRRGILRANFHADLSQVVEVKKLVNDAAQALGGLDVVIHCASIFEKVPFSEVIEQDWDRALAIDLKAAFFLAQAAAAHIKERGGKIILFSDGVVANPYPSYLPYCIAKAGVDGLAKGLAKVLGPKVAVHVVRPRGRGEHVDEAVEEVVNDVHNL